MLKGNVFASILTHHVFLSSFGAIIYLIKAVVKPILYTNEKIQRIVQEEDFTYCIERTSGDEIGDLQESFCKLVTFVNDLLIEQQAQTKKAKEKAQEAQEILGKNRLSIALTGIMTNGSEDSLKNLQISLSTNREKLHNINDANHQINDILEKSKNEVSIIQNDSNEISQNISETKESTQELESSVEEISQVISLIKDISDQTNLLALNSAIEAARAGEHGRGFAVVADEVRKLAERTQKATSEVETSINLLKQNTNSMMENSTKSEQGINKTTESIERFSISLDGLISNIQDVSVSMDRIAGEFFANIAKIDHIVLKGNAYKSVFSHSVIGEFSDHSTCRFGQWYKTGEGKINYGNTQSYINIDTPHQIVHSSISQAMECVKSDNCGTNIDGLIKNFSDTEEASHKLFELIDSMLIEKSK